MNEDKLVEMLHNVLPSEDATNFNAWDFIHAFGSGKEALLYARLFYPEFVEVSGMVFLKTMVESKDDRERIAKASEHYNGDLVLTEISFNTVEIPAIFGRRVGELEENAYQQLGHLLVETWSAALRAQFPNKQFLVRLMENDRLEPTVVFHQMIAKVGQK